MHVFFWSKWFSKCCPAWLSGRFSVCAHHCDCAQLKKRRGVVYFLRLDPYPDLLLLKGQQGRTDLYKGKTEPPLAFSQCTGLSPLNLPILLPVLPLLNHESFQFSWLVYGAAHLWCWTVTRLESVLSVVGGGYSYQASHRKTHSRAKCSPLNIKMSNESLKLSTAKFLVFFTISQYFELINADWSQSTTSSQTEISQLLDGLLLNLAQAFMNYNDTGDSLAFHQLDITYFGFWQIALMTFPSALAAVRAARWLAC